MPGPVKALCWGALVAAHHRSEAPSDSSPSGSASVLLRRLAAWVGAEMAGMGAPGRRELLREIVGLSNGLAEIGAGVGALQALGMQLVRGLVEGGCDVEEVRWNVCPIWPAGRER